MFISALFEFGKIDLIGYTLIVMVLLDVFGNRREEPMTVRQQ
jgi:hypothetical protein